MNESRKRVMTKLQKREAIAGYLVISPWLIGVIIFTAGPIIASLIISFCKWSVLEPPSWIGIENYQKLFKDTLFWQSLKVTSYYSALAIPLGVTFGLLVALLMNQKVRAITWLRTIYYLPAVVSGVAVALLWRWIFNPELGVINNILKLFGIEGPAWLTDESWVIPSFVIMSLWAIGGGMIIYLAGLQGIPQQLYEAADIDGANWWNKFWNITIPMISPIIFFNLVMGIIGSFQIFTRSYIMTDGGPNNASLFYLLYLYRNAFRYFKMGYASSLAWVLFLIILICTLLVFKSSPMWVYYEGTLKGK